MKAKHASIRPVVLSERENECLWKKSAKNEVVGRETELVDEKSSRCFPQVFNSLYSLTPFSGSFCLSQQPGDTYRRRVRPNTRRLQKDLVDSIPVEEIRMGDISFSSIPPCSCTSSFALKSYSRDSCIFREFSTGRREIRITQECCRLRRAQLSRLRV